MKTLYLLRHAKAVAEDAYPDDHARPLNARGRDAAAMVGQFLQHINAEIDLALCSTAERTKQTLELITERLTNHAVTETRYEKALYLASAGELLAAINSIVPDYESVILIGHNPGIHRIAVELAGEGEKEMLESLHYNFPTAALACFSLEGPWKHVTPGSARLERYITPKMLEN